MDLDPEMDEPFPVDRDGRRFRSDAEQPDGNGKTGCCEKFQLTVSRWMLHEDHRDRYLERANCCPPPIFIILISIGEVRGAPALNTPASLYHFVWIVWANYTICILHVAY